MGYSSLLFIGNIGGTELVLILLVVVLFFGGKKIPELMKGLGKGVKSFKQGMAEVDNEVGKIKDDINKVDNTSDTDKQKK